MSYKRFHPSIICFTVIMATIVTGCQKSRQNQPETQPEVNNTKTQEPIDQAVDNCPMLNDSKAIATILKRLEAESTTEEVWKGYKLSNNPLLLVDFSLSTNCATLKTKNTKPQNIKFEKTLPMPNKLYNFCAKEFPNCEEILAKTQSESVVILNAGSQMLEPLRDILKIDPIDLLFAMGVHEGFHLFGQMKSGVWKIFGLTGLARQQVEELCYSKNDEIADIRRKEMFALYQSFDSSFVKNNKTEALQFAKEFLSLRKSRYALVNDIAVQNSNDTISCQEAEARMEMNEGTPDFIQSLVMLQIGAMDKPKVSQWIKLAVDTDKNKSAHYYKFGSMQILILSTERFESSIQLSEHFLGIDDWSKTIGYEFESWVKLNSP